MAQENFNVSQPNDGLGDKLRAAFIKQQSNNTELYTNKVDKEAGKGLSTNDYTTTEKNKLANIEDFAEVNVQADFLQNDNTADDFIKNKPAIPVVADYLLNGGYSGTAQDLEDTKANISGQVFTGDISAPNLSGTNTGDQDLSSYALLDDIPVAGQLIKVTENNQTGYRLKDSNPANYGDIGQDAVDLSISTSASATKGATGVRSHAEGKNTTASGESSHAEGDSTTALGFASHVEGDSTTTLGFASHAEGFSTTASGEFSHAEGDSTTALGFASHAEGQNTTASGSSSHAEGQDTFARSRGEHSGGIFGTDYTPQSSIGFNLIDRLVNYGNGVDGSNRRDAYTLFKNGMQKFFTAALTTITNATKGSVMLDENARMNIHDGIGFKAVAFIQDIGVSNSKNLGPTGLNQGGILTINTDAAKFDLSAGFGYIVNGHSDPDNPTYTKVTWVAKIANAIPNLATQKQTYVAIDINGDLYFTNVPLTATQRRNFIRIGVLIHLNNSAVTYIDNQPTINIEIGGQVQDILEALGFRSLSGNRIFPVSNNLKIKKELGRVFKSGANFDNLTTQPHSFTLAAQEPITFRYRTQTGDEGSDITDITPAIYDLNGTITPVAATATLATIQRVYIFQDGVIRIQPGQRVFTTLNAAITALNSDIFVTDLDIAENGLYLGAIVLTRNAVDLSNISQAIFAPSIGTTANGSVSSPALGYTAEDVANKQNSLAVDGTGTKYPTVDAVKAVLSALLPTPLLGNVLRGNGTAYAAISEVEFMRVKSPFLKSHLATDINFDKLIYWDNFIRADAVSLGTADSGQVYQNLNGAGFQITGNEATGQAFSITAIPIISAGAITSYISKVLLRNSPPNSATASGFGFLIDKDNYIAALSTRNEINITKRTAGVDTAVASISYLNNGITGIDRVNSQFDFTFRIYSNSARTIIEIQSDRLNISNSYNINDVAYFNNVNFFGLINPATNNQGNIISAKLIKDL